MSQKKNYNLLTGVIALVAIVLFVAITGYIVSRPKPLVIQGEVEATEYRVSGKMPGRIEKLYVREGAMVGKGDTVVFVNSPEVRAKLAQATAAKSAADAQREKAENGAEKEQIAGARELWQQATVQEEIMRKSFDRMQTLYDKKVISDQQYDEVKAKYDASKAQSRAAKSQYDMALKGAREEDIMAARALVDKAEGAIAEVKAYLGDLYLTSPADGVVSNIFPHTGELVGTGAPVMSIIDLEDVWFTFNVREDYLHGLRNGDKITVNIPAISDAEFTATVNYIAVRESYATWKATKETDMYDAKTFEVRAVPDETIYGLRPGMSVIVKETSR